MLAVDVCDYSIAAIATTQNIRINGGISISLDILPTTSPIVVWKVTWYPAAIRIHDDAYILATVAVANCSDGRSVAEHVRRGPGGVIRLVDLLIRPSVPSRRNVIAADKRTERQQRRFIAGSVTTVASHAVGQPPTSSTMQSAARLSCRSRDDSIKDEMSTTSAPHAWFWSFMSSGTLLSAPQ